MTTIFNKSSSYPAGIQVGYPSCPKSVFFFSPGSVPKSFYHPFFWGRENFVEVEVVLEAPVKADELELTITGEVLWIM